MRPYLEWHAQLCASQYKTLGNWSELSGDHDLMYMTHKWLKEMDWSKNEARPSSWGVQWKDKSQQSKDVPVEIPTGHTK